MSRILPAARIVCAAFFAFDIVAFAETKTDSAKLPQPVSRAVDFEKDVRPIFEKHCVKCHGPDKQKGDLRLDEKTAALKGGENGASIVAGRSGDSPLIHRVARLDKDEA